ncbi:MAG: DNA adenine methylase [Rhizobiaceae bacterium]|nr:DNA adenine methylase [Rhizobiaceae bacterium]
MTAPTRPVLRWHGGKWKLAPWVIAHFPLHRVYVEPFGGAGSVLLRKPRCYAEIWNDLDDEVVNLFRVLRDERLAARLIGLLELTPFARAEFMDANGACDDPVERARRLCIRAFMGFGSNAHSSSPEARRTGFRSHSRVKTSLREPADGGYRSTGFRANSARSGTTPAHDWAHYPEAVRLIVERVLKVTIEHRDALEVMAQHDSRETLHYVDPPYLPETRSPANRHDLKHRMYRHELTAADHAALLDFLKGLSGMVVLSGYPSALYDAALHDWRRVTTETHADGARKRTEVLWINPAACDALDKAQAPLLARMQAPVEAPSVDGKIASDAQLVALAEALPT